MNKIKILNGKSDLFDPIGLHMTTSNNETFYFLPYWFSHTKDKDVFKLNTLGRLPKDLIDTIGIMRMENAFPQISWISVKEMNPPRLDEDYLVVVRNKNKEGGIPIQDVKNYTSDGVFVGGNTWEDVVYWSELPKSPF